MASSSQATDNQDNKEISKSTNPADPADQSKNVKGNDNANVPSQKGDIEIIIPTVKERLEALAQSRNDQKQVQKLGNDQSSGEEVQKLGNDQSTGEEVQKQVQKLRNDLTYIGNSLNNLVDNPNTLNQRIMANSSVLVDALNRGSKFEGSAGKQLQDKLNLLNKVVKKLKHQISSNKLSPTDSNAYKDIDINEFDYSQVLDILPVLHLEGNFKNRPAFRDFRQVYESLAPTTKLCLLCFAIIPENEVVKKRFMTYWWVGEGFVSPKTGERYEEVAERIFQELETKGCIEAEEKKFRDVADSCKMDPFIRSAVIVLAKEAGFFDFEDTKGNPTAKFKSSYRACLVDGFSQELVESGSELVAEKSGKSGSKSNTDKNASKSGSKAGTDKSGSGSDAEKTDPEKLQIIFNVNEPYPDVFDLELFSKLKNVKVLYLGRWQTSARHHIEVESVEFLKGLKSMKLLRFFSLQGVSRITKLPLSVCELPNLMILDLRACHNLVELPDRIGELRRLTHLDLSECYLLDSMPKGIGDLSELQVLKGFVISNGNSSRKNCTLDDLVKLQKLRKLSIYINTRDLDVCPLLQFNALQKLTITWGAGAFDQSKVDKNKGAANTKSPQDSGDVVKQDEGVAQPSMTATTTTPKNSGGNKNQDKGVPQSKAATTKSPQMSEDAAKQEEGVTQPKAGSSMNPENGGDNRKQDRGSGQPISATTTNSKNVGDKKTQDVGVAQLTSVTTTSSNKVGDKKTQDVGVAQPITATAKSPQPETETTTTPKNCWGSKKQDKAVAHPMTDRVFKKLEKLDLKCYPFMTAPNWLLHKKLPKLEKLYIRGGCLQNLSLVQDQNDKWPNVKVVRLKFLSDFKMDWKKLRSSFPDLSYLEIFECPKLTYFPCNEKGVIRLRP